jgi:hypothetical protein
MAAKLVPKRDEKWSEDFKILSLAMNPSQFVEKTEPPDAGVVDAFRNWTRKVLEGMGKASASGQAEFSKMKAQFGRFWQAYSYWIECAIKPEPTICQKEILILH